MAYLESDWFCHFSHFLFSFIFLAAGLLLWLEPDFTSYGDSLWYSFVTATTVGYGDMLVTTAFGRIISIILAIYGILFWEPVWISRRLLYRGQQALFFSNQTGQAKTGS